MADRGRWNLRGPVRNCRFERISYIFRRVGETCEPQEHTSSGSAEFSDDGRLTRTEHRNHDGSIGSSSHEYGDDGRVTAVRSVDKAGNHIRTHEYDSDGRLARVVTQSANGDPRVVETYEYDAAGCRTKTFYVDMPSNMNIGFGVEGSDSAYSAPGTAAVQTIYNAREQPTSMVFLDASGKPISRVELTYDESGNLIEEAQILATEAHLAGMNDAQRQAVRVVFGSTHRTHRYDENGRRVETRSKLGLLGEDRRAMTYNEHGDRIAEIDEHVAREYQLDDDGKLSSDPTKENVSRSESRIQYDYDARGNWVTKSVEGRSAAATDFVSTSVERRLITYFE